VYLSDVGNTVSIPTTAIDTRQCSMLKDSDG
jgi:hypothetical protein